MTQERLSRLIAEMKNNRLDTLAINPGASLLYLTGLHFHLMERPVVLLIRPSTTPVLVVPQLEAIKVKQSTIPLTPVPYGDDPREWPIAFLKAFQILGFYRKSNWGRTHPVPLFGNGLSQNSLTRNRIRLG